MTTTRLKLAFLVTAVSLSGCWRRHPAPEFEPITLNAANASTAVDYSGLAAVLKAAVSSGGEISPEKLKDNAKMLEGQLMLMALTGPKTRPELFKDDHSILNYWYNARAAWSMRLMLTFSRERLKAAGEKTAPSDRWRFDEDGVAIDDFNNRSFPIDGRSMTLAIIDSLLIKEFGFKCAVGAPGVSPVRGAIPAEPFNTYDTGALVDKRFNELVDDEARFVIDASSQQILIPPILWRFAEQTIATHEQKYGASGANLITALLSHTHLSPHRRLQDAIGYTCIEAPDPKVPLIVKRED
ncbi:MAG: hypothetical protein QGH94_00540 [Phycisphaerae bacterium]|jgi:hypothetical protein|nr:hypothetical protein [Phycisphaerae bacterium]